MARQLVVQNTNNNYQGTKLDSRSLPFKIGLTTKLDNGFSFKDLTNQELKKFDDFLKEIFNKNLTISQVDDMFKRTRGTSDTITVDGIDYELVHLGKDRTPLRLFGYYNNQGYFILTAIDGSHSKHKS